MGCGGSTTYSEDGSIVAGKGDTKIEWNADKPVEVGMYYYTEADAKILVKEFPMDKECVEKMFTADNVISSSGGMHWVKVVPGTRYAFKYTEGGHSVAFPGAKALEIPKKVHAFHTADDEKKDKLVEDLKKEAKNEGNPYKEEGCEDKVKADIDAIGGLTTCTDMSDDMVVFKKACMTVEDLQPYNTLAATLDVWPDFGTWDEVDGKLARQLGLADKVKVKAEEEIKKKGPQVGHKALSTVQQGFKKVIEGAIEGASKKAGPSKDELAPNVSARVDNMDGCVPGIERVGERLAPEDFEVIDAIPEAEGDADPVFDAAKATYEADKGRIADLKAKDGANRKGEVEGYLKSLYGGMSAVDPAVDADKIIVANVEGFQAPGAITSVGDENVTVAFCGNNFQDPSSLTIPKQVDSSKISGTTAEETKLDAFTSIGEAKEDFLERGRWVNVKEGNSFNQAWIKRIEGDDVIVEDQFKVLKKVKKSDCYTHVTQQHLATRGVALTPNFAPMKFWWIAAEDQTITTRKVRVWRFGSDEVVEVDLKPVTQKAKPTKEEENPDRDIHAGYVGEVELLLGAKYAYNFQIGDEYFSDFGAKLNSAKGCKVITVNSRIEY